MFLIECLKIIGVYLATISLARAGVGIGNVYRGSIEGISRDSQVNFRAAARKLYLIIPQMQKIFCVWGAAAAMPAGELKIFKLLQVAASPLMEYIYLFNYGKAILLCALLGLLLAALLLTLRARLYGAGERESLQATFPRVLMNAAAGLIAVSAYFFGKAAYITKVITYGWEDASFAHAETFCHLLRKVIPNPLEEFFLSNLKTIGPLAETVFPSQYGAALACLVGGLAFVLLYMDSYNPFFLERLGWMLFLLGVGLTTNNLFIFFLVLEILLLPFSLGIGLGGYLNRRLRAARIFLFYTLVGSLLILYVLVELYIKFKTLNIITLVDLKNMAGPDLALAMLFFVGLATKLPLIPFHRWLLEAHTQASTALSMLLAGALLKIGAYGFYLFFFTIFFQELLSMRGSLLGVLLFFIVVASCCTAVQQDIKLVVAWSSIAHMGASIASLVTLSPLGELGFLISTLAHTIYAPFLFLVIGIIQRIAGTREISYMSGLAARSPAHFLFFIFLLFLSNAGLPVSIYFFSEFLFFAALGGQQLFSVIFICFIMLLSLFYSIKLILRLTGGSPFKQQLFTLYQNLRTEERFAIDIYIIIALAQLILVGSILF